MSLEIGTLVTFKNKYGYTCKGKITDLGEDLPEELKALGGITVEAKPFIHIGDDMNVSCVVKSSSVKVITPEQFEVLPWATK